MLENNIKKIFLSFLIILIIFAFDRISKLYILNLAETEKYLDIYYYYNFIDNNNIINACYLFK